MIKQMPDYLGNDQRKQCEDDNQSILKRVNELAGVEKSDTGLAAPALWDLAADKVRLSSGHPLQVKLFAKFVVDLAETVAPTDIEERMRVEIDRTKYQIHIPLPPKIDPSVTMMQVEEKSDVLNGVPDERISEIITGLKWQLQISKCCFLETIVLKIRWNI